MLFVISIVLYILGDILEAIEKDNERGEKIIISFVSNKSNLCYNIIQIIKDI